MIICKKCHLPMIGVMSFAKGRHERFCKCPKCRDETKHQRIRDIDLDFKEVLRKATNN